MSVLLLERGAASAFFYRPLFRLKSLRLLPGPMTLTLSAPPQDRLSLGILAAIARLDFELFYRFVLGWVWLSLGLYSVFASAYL